MSEDYVYLTAGENYERVTNIAGVRTTICKNRFEVACQDRTEIDDQSVIRELKTWLAKRREQEQRDEEMRNAGRVSGSVS